MNNEKIKMLWTKIGEIDSSIEDLANRNMDYKKKTKRRKIILEQINKLEIQEKGREMKNEK